MQMCTPHYSELRQAIHDRGLWHLVSKNGKQAMERAEKQLKHTDDKKTDHDPLLNAYFAIVTNALQRGGLYLMGMDEDGKEYCPLCELAKNIGAEWPAKWIEHAANDEKKFADEAHGVLPS